MRRALVPILLSLLAACGSAQPGSSASAGLLTVGAPAPDFVAMDQSGQVRQLRMLRRDRPMVLFFYPRDGTPGCTAEACAFRDAWDRIEGAGATIVGVSTDDVESHRAFAEEHDLSFPLLADPAGEILERYGVPTRMGMSARVTFVIDRDGRIARVFDDVDPALHVDEVVSTLLELAAPPGTH